MEDEKLQKAAPFRERRNMTYRGKGKSPIKGGVLLPKVLRSTSVLYWNLGKARNVSAYMRVMKIK